ncbi:MAG TPA: LON peptidase substrate-binding domain-containing protein [Pirellulales bacterium]|nr:LON peptidase substrate-binding domain-containing protein [Pirellulales bacterium]
MSDLPDELSFHPDEFSGKARLFPLPNLVLFPSVLQPLHVFEPRYRDLVAEALEGDKLVAMGILAPGWEPDYEGRPPLAPVACLGRITTCQRMEGGRYNLLLVGLARVGLVRELPPTKSFREAEVEVFEDHYPSKGFARRQDLQRRLLDEFKRLLPQSGPVHEPLEQLLAAEVPLGLFTDIMAYTINLGIQVKQQLLAERNVDQRAATLLAALAGMSHAGPVRQPLSGGFPPDFSEN